MPTFTREPPDPWRLLWPTLLVVVVIASCAGSLGVPFLLDDFPNVVDNASLRAWGSALWPRAEVLTAGRPLLNLSLALDHRLGGASPRAFHATNILIHTLATLALFGAVRRALLLASWPGPKARGAGVAGFTAALLWAVHPLQTASVTYISQRAESLMGLCYLLTCYAFLRAAEERRARWTWLAVASCWAGMLTKEVMVTAPVMILLFDRLFIAGSFREAWRERGKLHAGLAASWVVLAALMAASDVKVRGIGYGFEHSWLSYLQIESWGVLHYLRLAAWPFPLVFDHGPDLPLPSPAVVVVSCTLLALLCAGIARAWRRRPALAFAGCWFLLILAPTSSIVPVAGQPIAENRVYLPLAAWTVTLAVAGQALAGRRGLAALIVGAAGLTGLTVARNHTYGTELSLWGDTVAKRPGNSRAQYYYAEALRKSGQPAAAAEHLGRSLAVRPAAKTHFNLGVVNFQLGRFQDAADHFGAATRALPGDPASQLNYATALVRLGREPEALEHFREAARLQPESAECRLNLGITLARLGRFADAVREVEEARRLEPANPQVRQELARLRALQPQAR